MTRVPETARADQGLVRRTGAALLLVAAVIHVVLVFLFPFPVFQILFLASAAGMLAGALLLSVGATTAGWVLGGGTALLTAAGFVLRSTVGIPGLLPRPVPFASPAIGPVSLLVEVLAAALAVRALSRSGRPVVATAVAELRSLPGRSPR
jgi:hypothetical protein